MSSESSFERKIWVLQKATDGDILLTVICLDAQDTLPGITQGAYSRVRKMIRRWSGEARSKYFSGIKLGSITWFRTLDPNFLWFSDIGRHARKIYEGIYRQK